MPSNSQSRISGAEPPVAAAVGDRLDLLRRAGAGDGQAGLERVGVVARHLDAVEQEVDLDHRQVGDDDVEGDGAARLAPAGRQQADGRAPTPIVAMTANAMAGDRERCLVAGMDDYLAKPVNVQSILKAFEEEPPEETGEEVADFSPTPLKQLEWEHIQRVLAEHDGNISATARALGMHRRTLQRKLQKRPVRR